MDLRNLSANPEELAEQLSLEAKRIIYSIQLYYYAIMPVLYVIRQEHLYTHLHYENFNSWAEAELGMSAARANDLVNFWIYLVPRAQEIGMDPEDMFKRISVNKLRPLLKPIRDAAMAGTPLPEDEFRTLMHVAEYDTYDGLQRTLKGGTGAEANGPHQIAEDPEITFVTIKTAVDRYSITATNITHEEMDWVRKRLRPIFVDRSGEIL